jgi:hypothetical protein
VEGCWQYLHFFASRFRRRRFASWVVCAVEQVTALSMTRSSGTGFLQMTQKIVPSFMPHLPAERARTCSDTRGI